MVRLLTRTILYFQLNVAFYQGILELINLNRKNYVLNHQLN